MRYAQRLPHPDVRHLIYCYWQAAADAPPPGDSRAVLPDGCMELIVHFRELPVVKVEERVQTAAPRAFVGGQLTHALQLEPVGPTAMFGVRFQPWGAAPLLGLPVHELTNVSVPLADLPALGGAGLAARLAEAGAGQRFDVVDAWMLRLARRARALDALAVAAADRLQASHGALPVRTLAQSLGVSERHLSRTMAACVGLTPKAYGRILRLQHCLQALATGTVANLTEAAHFAGFSDQSHFSRDFRKVCGMPPGTMLRRHRPLAEPSW